MWLAHDASYRKRVEGLTGRCAIQVRAYSPRVVRECLGAFHVSRTMSACVVARKAFASAFVGKVIDAKRESPSGPV